MRPKWLVALLVVSLVARFTNWLPLNETWQPLTSWWVIGALVILTAIEFFADKFPAVNHVNDIIQTFVRPTAGAVLFAASTGAATPRMEKASPFRSRRWVQRQAPLRASSASTVSWWVATTTSPFTASRAPVSSPTA